MSSGRVPFQHNYLCNYWVQRFFGTEIQFVVAYKIINVNLSELTFAICKMRSLCIKKFQKDALGYEKKGPTKA